MLLILVGSIVFFACLAYLIMAIQSWFCFDHELLWVKLFMLVPLPLTILIMFMMPWSFIFPKYGSSLYEFLTSF